MRLFIALPVPADAKRRLTGTQAALLKKGARGRAVPPENLHLTLAFLGSVPDPAPAIEALKAVPAPESALSFEKLSLFGDVTVALFLRDAALDAYVRDLRAALDQAGISYDRQAFRPHVTLLRKTALPANLWLASFEPRLQTLTLPVKEVRLMQSDLSGEAPEYTAIYIRKTR